jgi:hypothetical protein
MAASKDYYVEPELEKDCEPANKDKLLVGEVAEDTEGCVEEADLQEG